MIAIDIIIPIYNKYPYLKELLDTLLCRQDLYDKIILVDDCSVDLSVDVINLYQKTYPDKIIAFFQEKNMGPHYARIKGAELSDKKYIMFIDADDLINLNGLERFLRTDLINKNYGIYYGKTLRGRANNTGLIKDNTRFKYKEINYLIELLYNTFPSMSGIIVRKDIVHMMSIGKCDWGEDMLFYVRTILQIPFLFFNETIGIYRIMENSRGNSSGTFSKRWQFIKTLNMILKKSHSFYFFDYLFFTIITIKTLTAWGIKKIQNIVSF
jgi:glycosyltransferase involved in cell wall biosynthesis